ncbi:hypothetical protein [Halopiger djelfimassiliensis]|nr:hypothetical protein [Halopiger djelfimassiliensis]
MADESRPEPDAKQDRRDDEPGPGVEPIDVEEESDDDEGDDR